LPYIVSRLHEITLCTVLTSISMVVLVLSYLYDSWQINIRFQYENRTKIFNLIHAITSIAVVLTMSALSHPLNSLHSFVFLACSIFFCVVAGFFGIITARLLLTPVSKLDIWLQRVSYIISLLSTLVGIAFIVLNQIQIPGTLDDIYVSLWFIWILLPFFSIVNPIVLFIMLKAISARSYVLLDVDEVEKKEIDPKEMQAVQDKMSSLHQEINFVSSERDRLSDLINQLESGDE